MLPSHRGSQRREGMFMAYKLDDCSAFLVNKTSKKLSDEMSQRFSSKGVTRNQWLALYYIFQEEGLNQKELARELDMKESSCTALLEKLEQEELVERAVHQRDKRQRVLILTEKGKEKLSELNVIAETFHSEVFKDISHEEVNVFNHVLEKMLISVE